MRRVLALILILCLCLCACQMAPAAKPERLDAETLAALREQYPYITTVYDIKTIDDFAFIGRVREPFSAVAAVTLGEWEAGYTVSTCPARIDRVLWSGKDLPTGDEITLAQQTRLMREDHLFDAFPAGQYVLFLNQWSTDPNCPEGSYGFTNLIAFYCTPDGYVLPMLEGQPGLEACAGLSLDAFAKRLDEVLVDVPTVTAVYDQEPTEVSLREAFAAEDCYAVHVRVTDKPPESFPFDDGSEGLYRIVVTEVLDCWGAPKEVLPGTSLRYRELGGQNGSLRYIALDAVTVDVGDELLLLGSPGAFLNDLVVLPVEKGKVALSRAQIEGLDLGQTADSAWPLSVALRDLKAVLTSTAQHVPLTPPKD